MMLAAPFSIFASSGGVMLLIQLSNHLHAAPKMPPSAPPAIPPITLPQIRHMPTPPIDPVITPLRPPVTPPSLPSMRCSRYLSHALLRNTDEKFA